jgi:hypothetical protein
MNKRLLSLLSFGMVLPLITTGQRFLEDVFSDDEIVVHSNIVFATNIDFLTSDLSAPTVPAELVTLNTAVLMGNSIPAAYFDPLDESTALKVKNIPMDIYEPDQSVDPYDNRPVIVFIHTGNLLPPPINGGPTGTKTDSSAVELCRQWARKGYVAVSCDYRLGWNPIAPTVQERRGTLLNAVYRAIHDVKMGVRYLRENAWSLNTYNIDETKIALYGQGTGGYISQAYATLDNGPVELYLEKFRPNPFDLNTSYVDTTIVGNVEGFGGLLNLYYDEGIPSTIHMSINAGGALADESWLEAGDVPMCAINCIRDDFAPFNEGTVIVTNTLQEVVEVQGPNVFIQKANDLGNNDVFAALPAGDPFTDRARSLYGQTFEVSNGGSITVASTPEGLFPLELPLRPYLANQASPWEWWDPNAPVAQAFVAPGVTAHMASLYSNPDMTPEKGRAYLDSIQGYILPRVMCVFELPNNPCENIPQGPENDLCANAADIGEIFNTGVGVVQLSDIYSNASATVSEDDPNTGWECFGEPDGGGDSPSVDNNVWFTFQGDGTPYRVLSNDCNGTLGDDYIFEGDTQFALYSGECGSLVPVACNEDSEDAGQGNYFAELEFETQEGVTYYLMVDGFDWTDLGGAPAVGSFCLQVTQMVVNIDEPSAAAFSLYPNPALGYFMINSENPIQGINIYNMVGELVYQPASSLSTTLRVNCENLSAGVYFVEVFDGENKSTLRVVVE